EGQVTVDGTTHALPVPFMVLATQTPVEMDGTFRLPEAQRDRFMARASLGYPPKEEEWAMLAGGGFSDPLESIRAVMGLEDVHVASKEVEQVHASDAVLQYILALVRATRTQANLALGLSPRPVRHMGRRAKSLAFWPGRDPGRPADVRLLPPAAWPPGHLV